MTNEELAVLIQNGERDKLLELWEQVQRFIRKQANRRAFALDGAGGITSDDLVQAGYLALVRAVDHFDPTAGGTFLTYFGYWLKDAFNQAAGLRTKRDREDPLQSAISMDVPVNEDDGGDTLGDFIEDPQATQCFEWVELHNALEKALHSLTEEQGAVIRCRYYQGLTLEQTGQALGLDWNAVRAVEQKAIRTLRHPTNSRELLQYR